MPVVFEAPQPFAPQISEGFGQTEQFNKTLPILAGLYESNQNRNLAASQGAANRDLAAQQATASNRERAYQTDVNTDNEFEAQRRNYAIQSELQARQIQAHQQSQMFDAAVKDRQVGHAEMMDAQRAEAGLSQLQQDVESGLVSKEEAADAAYFLRTKTDRVRQRVEAQHAEEYKSQAAMKSQEAANMAKDNAQMDKFEEDRIAAGFGTLKFHDNNGRLHVLLKNPKTGEWYNPLLEHNKMGADQEIKQQELEQKRYDNLQQRYDNAFAKREAEVRKIHEQRRKLDPGKSGYEADEPDGDQIDTEVRNDLTRRGIHPPSPPASRSSQGTGPSDQATGQTAPPNTPGQDAQAQNDQREPTPTSKVPAYDSEIEKIKSSPYNDEQKQQATGIVQGIREILAKGAKMTADDRRNLVNFRNLLKSYQAIKWE